MTKETLLKYKKIYEANGDSENLKKVLENLKRYPADPVEDTNSKKEEKRGK